MQKINASSSWFVLGVALGLGSQHSHAQCLLGEDALLAAGKGTVVPGNYSPVSTSGNWIALGAPDDDPDGVRTGAVYVFRFDGGNWIQHEQLSASDGANLDEFGRSVAIRGDVIVVGAKGAQAVYVFRYNGVNWIEEQKLVGVEVEPTDAFARTVAVDGNVVVVGSELDDHLDGSTNAGSAYVFRYDGKVWVEEQKLTEPDPGTNNRFGVSVAVDGDVLLVGAHLRDEPGFVDSGAAYVLRHDGNTWVHEQKLTDFDTDLEGNFGRSVTVRGDLAVVGKPADDDGSIQAVGSAYVFRFLEGTWILEQKLREASGEFGDQLGVSVATNGTNLVVVGAHGDVPTRGYGSGAAFVFRKVQSDWLLERKLVPQDEDHVDAFGKWVSMSGSRVVVWPYDPGVSASNAAFVYDLVDEDCNLNGIPDVADLESGDSSDCQPNCVPDECELTSGSSDDCNGTDLLDECDIEAGTSADCNSNGRPDECDIDDGASEDCNANGVPDECPVEVAQLAPSDPGADFGKSVSVCGNRLLVGAPRDYIDGIPYVGSANVFRREGMEWVEVARLTAADGEAFDRFGDAVSIGDDYAVIGATAARDPFGVSSGAAYVYHRDGAIWGEEAVLVPSELDAEAGDHFGYSVSISGDRIAVGAPDHQHSLGPVNTDAGTVYVFRREESGWVEEAELVPSDPQDTRYFGRSVSLYGDVLLVGDELGIHGDQWYPGTAYVFRLADQTWQQEAKLVADDPPNSSDRFGTAVAVHGDVAVIGAPGDDQPFSLYSAGSAYVFRHSTGEWTQEQKLTASDGDALDSFGTGVGTDGERILVGARTDIILGAVSAGSAYVYERKGPTWIEVSKLTASDGSPRSFFGWSASVDGNWAVVGAQGAGGGSCYVYSLELTDCNGNGVLDECDVPPIDPLGADCDSNGVPDECEPDCNGNGQPDDCDLDPTDPDGNGQVSVDCNENTVPDECDILDETSPDADADGIPDECQCFVSSAPLTDTWGDKNRYISVIAGDPSRSQAIRVRLMNLPPPFDVWNYESTGRDFFAGAPREVCENSGEGLEVPAGDCSIFAGPTRTFWAASLVCEIENAHYMDWHGWCDAGACVGGLDPGSCSVDDDCAYVVHLSHEGIVPTGAYDVQLVDSDCWANLDVNYSQPLAITQATWGDVCGPGPGGACSGVADGTVDVANDVLGVLDKFANVNNLQKARADLEPGDDGNNNGPDFKVNVANDVLYCLDAFTGAPYPFVPGNPCGPG